MLLIDKTGEAGKEMDLLSIAIDGCSY